MAALCSHKGFQVRIKSQTGMRTQLSRTTKLLQLHCFWLWVFDSTECINLSCTRRTWSQVLRRQGLRCRSNILRVILLRISYLLLNHYSYRMQNMLYALNHKFTPGHSIREYCFSTKIWQNITTNYRVETSRIKYLLVIRWGTPRVWDMYVSMYISLHAVVTTFVLGQVWFTDPTTINIVVFQDPTTP